MVAVIFGTKRKVEKDTKKRYYLTPSNVTRDKPFPFSEEARKPWVLLGDGGGFSLFLRFESATSGLGALQPFTLFIP
jgi:hypothetical protein